MTESIVVVNKIKLLCVLASQDGLSRVHKEYPGVEVSSDQYSRPRVFIGRQIWVSAVDPHLTPNGLISPGLGDTVRQVHLEFATLRG